MLLNLPLVVYDSPIKLYPRVSFERNLAAANHHLGRNTVLPQQTGEHGRALKAHRLFWVPRCRTVDCTTDLLLRFPVWDLDSYRPSFDGLAEPAKPKGLERKVDRRQSAERRKRIEP